MSTLIILCVSNTLCILLLGLSLHRTDKTLQHRTQRINNINLSLRGCLRSQDSHRSQLITLRERCTNLDKELSVIEYELIRAKPRWKRLFK